MKLDFLISDRARSFYKWILVIAAAFLFSRIANAQNITGSGTIGSPYILYDEADFDSIRYLTNWGGGTTTYYEIANDMDFTSFGDVSEMNGLTNNSGLVIEGNDHTLSNMTIAGSGGRQALFGDYLPGAGGQFSLTNLNFDSVSLSRTDIEAEATGLLWAYGFIQAAFVVENVTFTNCGIYITETGGALDGTSLPIAFIMGYLQFMDAANEYVRNVTFDGCSLIVNSTNDRSNIAQGFVGGLTNMTGVTDTLIENITVRNSVIHGLQPSGNRSNGARSFAGGIFGSTTGHPTILNCYSYNNEFKTSLAVTLPSTEASGGLIGYTSSIAASECKLENCYTAQITATSIGAAGAGLGTIIGTTDNDYVLDSVYSEDHATLAQFGSGTPAGTYFEKTTSEMKNELTYVNWDFVNTWSTNVGINDGYPYLLWTATITISVTEPNTAVTLVAGDSYNIHWGTIADTTWNIYLSTNSGSSWTTIAEDVADTIYNWTVITPTANIYEQALIQVALSTDTAAFFDNSDVGFSILNGNEFIKIISPIEKSIDLPATEVITWTSGLVDTFNVYFSYDSTTWYEITTDLLRDGDGIYPDTTTYNWALPLTITTGNIYVKVTATSDTSQNFTAYEPGDWYYTGFRTYSHGSYFQYKIRNTSFFVDDDKLYTGWFFSFVFGWYDLSDRVGLNYFDPSDSTWQTASLQQPNKTYYPENDCYIDTVTKTIFLTNGTVPTSLARYRSWDYTLGSPFTSTTFSIDCDECIGLGSYDDSQNDSVTYNNNRYTIDQTNKIIYVRDLVNNVIQEFASFDGLSIAEGKAAIFAYEGLIFLGSKEDNGRVYLVGVAPDPILYAEDARLCFVITNVRRNYFRGIYPEAILEMTSGK